MVGHVTNWLIDWLAILNIKKIRIMNNNNDILKEFASKYIKRLQNIYKKIFINILLFTFDFWELLFNDEFNTFLMAHFQLFDFTGLSLIFKLK